MSVWINNRQITSFYYKNRALSAIYKGTRLVWQKTKTIINSLCCFSGDTWDDSSPWVDTDTWKN